MADGAESGRTASEPLAFASFMLDLRAGQLRRDGTPIALRPKTWAVLLYLVERPGVLVTREELLDAVWPDVAVTLDTLTKSIGELRVALDDDPKQPRYIETVHRRGFRFLDRARPISASGALAAPEADAAPFIGRVAELQRLHECLARARTGERQLVFISGPAGAGKTALLEAFLRSPALRDPALQVAMGASIDQHGECEAYMPLLEALERLAQAASDDRVFTALRVNAPSWLLQIPWLAHRSPELNPTREIVRPERMLRECVALLEALAANATVVLALEDLHWSDPSTVDLLNRLGQRRDSARLMIVVTYRAADAAVHDHPLARAVRALRAQHRCVDLTLDDLSVGDVAAYLGARFPGGSPPADLAAALHQHTDGNPLFLRAVADHIVAQGWALDTAPGWSFAAMPERPNFGLPGDARDMVSLQINRLGPADRRLLEVASVVGREFSPALLATALGHPTDVVEASVEALAHGGRFLVPVAAGSASTYGFTHELYRQAVYRDMAPDRRRRLHGCIATALEAEHGNAAAEVSAELAHHCEQGGNVDGARRYLLLASERARQLAAPREANAYLERALSLASLPGTADRQRHELQLRLARSTLLLDLFGPASAALLENCERALALCSETEQADERFQLLYALAHVCAMRGDTAGFDTVAASLQTMATAIDSHEHRLLADAVCCFVAAIRGHFSEAWRLAERVRTAAASGEVAVPPVGAHPVAGVDRHGALAAWMMGNATEAWGALEHAGAVLAGSVVTPFTHFQGCFFECLLAMLEGDARRVRDAADAALRQIEEFDLGFWKYMIAALRGWARLHLDDVDGGMQELRDAQVGLAESGTVIFSTYLLAFLAQGHCRLGDTTAGLAAVEKALAVADATLDRSCWPELWRLKAELLLAAGGAAGRREAAACLQRAIDVARGCEARALELRAATDLATLWLDMGRGEAGRTLVAAALAAVEPADTSDQRRAQALLSAAASDAPRVGTRH